MAETEKNRLFWNSDLVNERDIEMLVATNQPLFRGEGFDNFSTQMLNLFEEFCGKKSSVESWSEKETISNWIMPVLDALGWRGIGRTDRLLVREELSHTLTDLEKSAYGCNSFRLDIACLATSDAYDLVKEDLTYARQFVSMPLEAKYWGRIDELLGARASKSTRRKNERGDHETDADKSHLLDPEKQILGYMEFFQQKLGILTDGSVWLLFSRKHSMDSGKKIRFNLGNLFLEYRSSLLASSGTESFEQLFKVFYLAFSRESHQASVGEQSIVDDLIARTEQYIKDIEVDLKERFIGAMTLLCNAFGKSDKSGDLIFVRRVAESSLFSLLFLYSLEERGVLPHIAPDFKEISIRHIVRSLGAYDPELDNYRDPSKSLNWNREVKNSLGSALGMGPEGTEIYERLIKLYDTVNEGVDSKSFGMRIEGFSESVFSQDELKIARSVRVSNYLMAKVLFQLFYGKEGGKYLMVPFKVFSPRQIGSIYESFLEYDLIRATSNLLFQRKRWAETELSISEVKSLVGADQLGIRFVKKGELCFSPHNKERKITGSYYTPEFVVKYIIEQNIAPLLVGKTSDELLRLKICDPAMGSGHFLIELTYVLSNAIYAARLREKKADDLSTFLDRNDALRDAIKHCIRGVDINSSAVKLARLSLWSLVARFNMTLPPLNNSLRHGDSLVKKSAEYSLGIDWKQDFPDAFAARGFDAIIGNPPYVRHELYSTPPEYLRKEFETYDAQADIFVYFIEQAISLTKGAGRISFVTTNKWLKAKYARKVRKKMFETGLSEVVDFGDLPVFNNVMAYPAIMSIDKSYSGDVIRACVVPTLEFDTLGQYVNEHGFEMSKHLVPEIGSALMSMKEQELLTKIHKNGICLSSAFEGKIHYGIKTGYNAAFVLDGATARSVSDGKVPNNLVREFLEGKDIRRYEKAQVSNYILFLPKGWTRKNFGDVSDIKALSSIKREMPDLYHHLMKHKAKLEARSDQGEFWWELRACEYYDAFERSKIIFSNMSSKPDFLFDSSGSLCNQKCFIIDTDNKFLLGYLNSTLMRFLYVCHMPELAGGFFEPGSSFLEMMPIPKLVKQEDKATVTKFVDRLTQDHRDSKVSKEIDARIYSAFNLSKEEIVVLEKLASNYRTRDYYVGSMKKSA